jgi:hypothetical protein
VDSLVTVRKKREFGDFPAGAGQRKVKISTMLTSVAKSQEGWWQNRQAQNSKYSERYA